MICYRPKRSFGQGNVFTGVCDSVHGGGGVWSRGDPPIWGGSSNFLGGGLVPGGEFLQFYREGGGSSNFGGGPPIFQKPPGQQTPEYGQ